jgi:kynurenine formamidase
MKARIKYLDREVEVDLSDPVSICLPVARSPKPNAFNIGGAKYSPFSAGGFTGSVKKGGSCNCEDITFNPHGNGTHTECAGHISREEIYITDVVRRSMFFARVISLDISGQENITGDMLKRALSAGSKECEALVVRTLPNSEGKKSMNYSGTNPAYFSVEAIEVINGLGFDHLLTDLPSLDKEDDPLLKAHHAFFAAGKDWNLKKTVTEMVFVPDEIEDSIYLLDLQVAPFQSDASPSKPLLYWLSGIKS